MSQAALPLVGQQLIVVSAKNSLLVGLQGKIIDETKTMLIIECGGIKKRLLKQGLIFALGSGGEYDGTTMKKRPEDRLKT